jgi:NAD(P)-dependent dehydrogenase (short-subunit alcohol dehydrogenase family)
MTARFTSLPAIVTGAASGIGRATAQRLAAEGARVLAVDVNADGLAETAAGRDMHTLVADVAAADGPARILAAARTRLGGVALLANIAGIGGSHRAEITPDEELDRLWSVNLRSLFRLSRDALPDLRATRGAIVNIASIFAMVGFQGTAAYAAAKAGVIGMTMQMAADEGPHGVRVNAIAPGLIETAMTEKRIAGSAWFRGQMTEATPLGRAGTPADIAGAIAFLFSADAAFITGQTLVVDGGWLATRYRAGADIL